MSGDLSETELSSEARHPQTGTDITEEKVRSRLFKLATKMSEKDTSSGEDQESEPKTESENQKESLSSEDNSQSVQEELKKVRAMKPPATAWCLQPGCGERFCIYTEDRPKPWQKVISDSQLPACAWVLPTASPSLFTLDLATLESEYHCCL